MKFVFDSQQAYQLDAIRAIVGLFQGQPHLRPGSSPSSATSSRTVANQLLLSEEQLLANLRAVQVAQGVAVTAPDLGAAAAPAQQLSPWHYSLEMETGTGKTYVYLRSIYELHQAYGFTKYVIVVPSVAIREGVLKSLQLTAEHFRQLYTGTPATYKTYDSSRISELAQFARSSSIQILVINIDAFAKDINVINQLREQGLRPIEYLQQTRPIAIIDEPQNMETDVRRRAIERLHPLCTLRFSATHRRHYQLIYRLDPVRAHQLELVKQIEVDALVVSGPPSEVPLRLLGFGSSKGRLTAKLEVTQPTTSALDKTQLAPETHIVTVEVGSDLAKVYDHPAILDQDLQVAKIDKIACSLTFTNGRRLELHQASSAPSDELLRAMIDATIEHHFRKQVALQQQGIKVLSLFFIDRVAHYRQYGAGAATTPGKFARWFEQSYAKWQAEPGFAEALPFAAAEVHDGYFSQDKTGRYRDSSESRSTRADDDTFQLIMRDKERLLDPAEPLRFIFSHSALREGWDNPNIFQICTLKSGRSAITKRQEIGRGLRLCVDARGRRVHDRAINRLTVIASESYEAFARALQQEYSTDCGVDISTHIHRARSRRQLRLHNGWRQDPRLLELWARVAREVNVEVVFDTQTLIQQSVQAINAMPRVESPHIQRTLHLASPTPFDPSDGGASGQPRQVAGQHLHATHVPDTAANTLALHHLVERLAHGTHLTRATVAQVLRESGRLEEAIRHPRYFLQQAASVLSTVIDDIVAQQTHQETSTQLLPLSLLQQLETQYYEDELYQVEHPEKTVSKMLPVRSAAERAFVRELDLHADVTYFLPLPPGLRQNTSRTAWQANWASLHAKAQAT